MALFGAFLGSKSPQRERVTSGRLSDPPVLFDANWKPVGPSRVLPARSEMNLAAPRTVKLLPAHPIWLFRKFCIIRISGRLVSACQRTGAAPPFRFGETQACFSHRIVNDHSHCPDILSLRQKCPSLASVSGKWSLLDGMSAIATGSFAGTNPINSSHRDLSRRYPSTCSSPRSIVTWTPPAARPCHGRAARLLAAGWFAGCSRQGFLDPERETPLDDVLTPLELPTPPVPGGTGNVQGGQGDRPERQRRSGDAHAGRPQDLGCHGRMSSTAIWLPCRPSITTGTC